MERRVYRYETVGSTNTELMALARQGAAEGTVVLARQQTAGRVRMGRSFQSPAGLGLYGSVLLRSSPEVAPRIPALAATAVSRALRRSCGLSCGTASGDGGAAAGVRSRLPEFGPPGPGAAPRRRAGGAGGVPDTGLRPCGAL